MLTILFAAVVLNEPLTRTKLLLASISVVGIVLLMLNNAEGGGQSSLTGDLLVLLGTLFAVCYVLVSKNRLAPFNHCHWSPLSN
ncbi:MAG: hypothetical protein HC899_34940 [Leptolyngbyaceae cyanobacterium SM1_4_3]|nr:hypothetical protein [Leptolyngbyaceae cyanobacterium SM1_4_3]